MDAKELFKKLKEQLKSNNSLIDKTYWDNTKWTETIKYIVEEKVITKECTSREYYRVDSLKYEHVKLDETYEYNRKYFDIEGNNKTYLNVYNWKNKIAIEYENNKHDWTDELIKLSHLRCDLKVIIAYSEWVGENGYKSIIEKKLDFAIKLLKSCEKQSINDKWLIIFGPCSVKNKKEIDIVENFVGYKMQNGKFVEVDC